MQQPFACEQTGPADCVSVTSTPGLMYAPTLALMFALAGTADTARVALDTAPASAAVAALDTVASVEAPRLALPESLELSARLDFPASLRIVQDTTPRRRRKSVEVSEWYERRLRIHRYGAYSMIPLFALQAYAGNQLYNNGAASGWKNTHRFGATALATVFTVNTVTGVWNLWDSRSAPQGRTKRYLHSLLMLASDAGFTYAGVKLSNDAENSADARRKHRNLAYASMGTALVGSGIMVIWRKD
ncbi:MAG TPA: hypothetical protein VGP25_22045 [Gemmatimonadaceae bacterium]|nr:hypothetical protein [Gemmatimonadaceae bacterium]